MDLGPWPDDLGGVGLMDRAQRIAGLRVQLTGQGGDFWCDGSGLTIADALARVNPKGVLRESRAWAASDRPDHLLSTFLREGLAPIVAARLPAGIASKRWRCPPWVGTGLADRTNLRDRMVHRDDRLGGRHFRSPSQRARFAMVHDPMTQWGLLLDDRAGGRRGIEERHPFHDRRLVEFSLLTPEWTRSREGRTRRAQRRAMKATLPEEVRTRVGKAEFSHRFAGAFADLLAPRLAAGLRSAERGWVNPAAVQQQLQECLAVPVWRPHCYPLAAVLGVELLLEAADDRSGSVQTNGVTAHG